MTGAEVKKMIMDNGIRLWAVAEQLGVSDNYFSRRMRKMHVQTGAALSM